MTLRRAPSSARCSALKYAAPSTSSAMRRAGATAQQLEPGFRRLATPVGPRRRSVNAALSGGCLLLRTQPRIERVAQGIAEEVEAEHREADRHAGKERHPGRGLG